MEHVRPTSHSGLLRAAMDTPSDSSSAAAPCNTAAHDAAPPAKNVGARSPDTVGACSPDTAPAENVGALLPDTAAEANRCLFELRWAFSGTLIKRIGNEWETMFVGQLIHRLGAGAFADYGVPPAATKMTADLLSKNTGYTMKAPNSLMT